MKRNFLEIIFRDYLHPRILTISRRSDFADGQISKFPLISQFLVKKKQLQRKRSLTSVANGEMIGLLQGLLFRMTQVLINKDAR